MYAPVDGRIPTGWLTGAGFGYDISRIDREIFR
jgi:hypothetical protein